MLIRLASIDDVPAISDLIMPLAKKYIAHELSDVQMRVRSFPDGGCVPPA